MACPAVRRPYRPRRQGRSSVICEHRALRGPWSATGFLPKHWRPRAPAIPRRRQRALWVFSARPCQFTTNRSPPWRLVPMVDGWPREASIRTSFCGRRHQARCIGCSVATRGRWRLWRSARTVALSFPPARMARSDSGRRIRTRNPRFYAQTWVRSRRWRRAPTGGISRPGAPRARSNSGNGGSGTVPWKSPRSRAG